MKPSLAARSRRAGLQALEAALDANEIDVLVVFTTSQLYRHMYKSLRLVQEQIVSKGRRAVFVRQGIDTDDTEFWGVMFQFYSMMDERMAASQAAMVRAGHEGVALRGLICGTLTFGYGGEVVPDVFTKKNNPARKVVVNEREAEWVAKIFQWYLGREYPAQNQWVRLR